MLLRSLFAEALGITTLAQVSSRFLSQPISAPRVSRGPGRHTSSGFSGLVRPSLKDVAVERASATRNARGAFREAVSANAGAKADARDVAPAAQRARLIT